MQMQPEGRNNMSIEINNREACFDKKLSRRLFCNFIYMNGKDGYGASYRQDFCKELMKYKKVDCLGRVLHNTDGLSGLSARYVQNWNDSKRDIIKNYKFTIAFENQPIEGYFTEKLIDPFMAHSIPIYWGDPTVTERFDKNSFINANGREIDDVIEEIIFYDTNEEAYMKMLQCKPLIDLSIIEDVEAKKKQFIEMIAEKGTRVVLQDGGVISDYPSQNIRKHPALFPFFTDVINWRLHYLYGSIKHKKFFRSK